MNSKVILKLEEEFERVKERLEEVTRLREEAKDTDQLTVIFPLSEKIWGVNISIKISQIVSNR